jgi:hypothetical protein
LKLPAAQLNAGPIPDHIGGLIIKPDQVAHAGELPGPVIERQKSVDDAHIAFEDGKMDLFRLFLLWQLDAE